MDEQYEPLDVIGTGSFGIIRKVRRRVDGSLMARKELNYGRMDERDLKQLTEEVNILEQLGANDNIVRYYERFVDKPNSMLYILMELCEGGDLSKVIQRSVKTAAPISEEVVWAYLTQITLALFDCHAELDAQGRRKPVILHRDLKPENVFLDRDNNLKLGDFGLSKAMAQAAMTQTYVGTPYYMSPELLNGQPYDVKSDIWALGTLIYELCAGHPPFYKAQTQPELTAMVREGKIPDLPRQYSARLNQVVKAMLKPLPKQRPNTKQIRDLDEVKIQIRILELRRATREIRQRDAQLAARENELLVREAAILQREKAIMAREAEVRQLFESLKLERQRTDSSSDEGSSNREDIENERPRGASPSVIRRVASRPSLVPRRPLDTDRRASNASMLPLPRVSSTTSLMSLDPETPIKPKSSTASSNSSTGDMRRRLASKSMHDLGAAAAAQAVVTPGRTTRSSADPASSSFGRRSESSASSPRRRAQSNAAPEIPPLLQLPNIPQSRSAEPSPVATSGSSFKPTPPPTRTNTAPPALHFGSMMDEDDIPSPFIKKIDSHKFASAHNLSTLATKGTPSLPTSTSSSSVRTVPTRASRMSLGGMAKTSLANRLLATRAQAQAGFEDISKRVSSQMARPKTAATA